MLPANDAFEAIGTTWSIDTERPLTKQEKLQIQAVIKEFDATYSRFRDDSLVSQIRAAGPGEYQFPESIVQLYDTYTLLGRLSGGAINPLVGASLEWLGYDAAYSLVRRDAPPFIPPSFTATVSRNGRTVSFKQPILLDIGAIGKGYLVDVVATIVSKRHDSYVIDGSGDVAVHSKQPEVIGLEDPRDPTRILGTVQLHNKSMCASATNRRAWGNGLHHIIDARTGLPTTSTIIASWAVAGTTMLADALATALFFVPAQRLQQVFGDFLYVILKKDGSIEYTMDAAMELYA